MFWKAAHRRFGHLGSQDPDIQKYLAVSDRIQDAGYHGIGAWVQDGGHRWVARRTPLGGRVLEIGFGNGRHRLFHRGTFDNYFVSEYSPHFVRSESWRLLRGRGTRCDARQLPFASHCFAAVVSVYNLEHIDDLQSVCREVHRVLEPGGTFVVALPCEGGLFWNVGRELTRPSLRRKYHVDFNKALAYEHRWDLPGVVHELRRSGLFRIDESAMIPFRIPTHHLNLVAGFLCQAVAGP